MKTKKLKIENKGLMMKLSLSNSATNYTIENAAIKTLKERIHQMKTDSMEYVEKIENLTQQVSIKENKIEELMGKLKNYKSKIKVLGEKCSEKENDFNKEELLAKIFKANFEMKIKDEQIMELSREKDEILNEAQKLRLKLSTSKNLSDTLAKYPPLKGDNKNVDHIKLITIVHCFANLLINIYTLFDRTLGKNKSSDLHLQGTRINKTFINDLANNVLMIYSSGDNIEESLLKNNKMIYDIYDSLYFKL